MKRRLSSLATPYCRFAPPLLLVVGVGWMITNLQNAQLIGALGPIYVILFALLSYWSLRLKKVHLSNNQLFISDNFTRIAVPVSDVKNVEVLDWGGGARIRMMKLTLYHASRFGSVIFFVPRGLGWSSEAVVDEICSARHAA